MFITPKKAHLQANQHTIKIAFKIACISTKSHHLHSQTVVSSLGLRLNTRLPFPHCRETTYHMRTPVFQDYDLNTFEKILHISISQEYVHVNMFYYVPFVLWPMAFDKTHNLVHMRKRLPTRALDVRRLDHCHACNGTSIGAL